MLKISAPIATAPIRCGAPSWPITAVSTKPIIGTVALESTIGSAIFSTSRWLRGACSDSIGLRDVPAIGRSGLVAVAAFHRREQARHQPDRDDDHGAEQEVADYAFDRPEAQIVDTARLHAHPVHQIAGPQVQGLQHDPDDD